MGRGLTFPTLAPRLKTVTFSPNGTVLAGGGFKGSITLWNVGTGEKLYQFRGHKDIITSLAFSPDGKLLASSSWDSKIKLWNPKTAEQMYILEGHTKEIYAIAFSIACPLQSAARAIAIPQLSLTTEHGFYPLMDNRM